MTPLKPCGVVYQRCSHIDTLRGEAIQFLNFEIPSTFLGVFIAD